MTFCLAFNWCKKESSGRQSRCKVQVLCTCECVRLLQPCFNYCGRWNGGDRGPRAQKVQNNPACSADCNTIRIAVKVCTMRLLLTLLARVFHGKTLMEFPFNVPGSDMRCNIDSGNLPHVTCLVLLPPLRRELSREGPP